MRSYLNTCPLCSLISSVAIHVMHTLNVVKVNCCTNYAVNYIMVACFAAACLPACLPDCRRCQDQNRHVPWATAPDALRNTHTQQPLPGTVGWQRDDGPPRFRAVSSVGNRIETFENRNSGNFELLISIYRNIEILISIYRHIELLISIYRNIELLISIYRNMEISTSIHRNIGFSTSIYRISERCVEILSV